MTALRLIERSCEEAVAANQAVLLDAWPDEPGARWVLSLAEHPPTVGSATPPSTTLSTASRWARHGEGSSALGRAG